MLRMATRRRFLSGAALAGAAGLLSPRRGWADEPALETTIVRIGRQPVICFAPQYVCEALLRADGFTDVRYVNTTVQTQEKELGRGELDFQSSLSLSHGYRDRCRRADHRRHRRACRLLLAVRPWQLLRHYSSEGEERRPTRGIPSYLDYFGVCRSR